MSDESRNVLVVTFEDSAEPVKVCVYMLVTAHWPHPLPPAPVGGTHRLISEPTETLCSCLYLVLGQTH